MDKIRTWWHADKTVTYAAYLLIAVVIVLIIAAMAQGEPTPEIYEVNY